MFFFYSFGKVSSLTAALWVWVAQAGEGSEIERGLLRSAIGAFTPSQVQEVKLVLRMLPIFFTTIFYWCAHRVAHNYRLKLGGHALMTETPKPREVNNHNCLSKPAARGRFVSQVDLHANGQSIRAAGRYDGPCRTIPHSFCHLIFF
jgi:hypothetical protein